jgi:hypothetical protein
MLTPSGLYLLPCRSTTKFWVRPGDIPRLRVALIRHLPVLMLGRVEGGLVQECAGREEDGLEPSLRVSRAALRTGKHVEIYGCLQNK